MPKVHFTPNYTYPNDGSIRAISVCGLHSGIADKNFIDCTIVETRVNCKNCLRVMNAAKKLQQPPVIKSVCECNNPKFDQYIDFCLNCGLPPKE
jgi:hypothetical protein